MDAPMVILHLRTTAGIVHKAVAADAFEVVRVVLVNGEPVNGDLVCWSEAPDLKTAEKAVEALQVLAESKRQLRKKAPHRDTPYKAPSLSRQEINEKIRRQNRLRKLAAYLDRVIL